MRPALWRKLSSQRAKSLLPWPKAIYYEPSSPSSAVSQSTIRQTLSLSADRWHNMLSEPGSTSLNFDRLDDDIKRNIFPKRMFNVGGLYSYNTEISTVPVCYL